MLEDNGRTPSGVSYMLQNRQVLKRVFPQLFEQYDVRATDDYPAALLDVLKYIAPGGRPTRPSCCSAPGMYNSAYFEHSFLAQRMGIELVEGRDLVVDQNRVFMRTTRGLQRVDVIYRRIDDDFLDPLTFRPDSTLGVPGLVNAYRAGNVALANSIGTGIADDKGIYPFVPDMIRYYLQAGPDPAERRDVPAAGAEPPEPHPGEPRQAGGQDGERIGRLRHADRPGLDGRSSARSSRDQVRAQPARLHRPADDPAVARTRRSSTAGSRAGTSICGRSSCAARRSCVVPGALTRVALPRGSLVVNSSQGGGSKDTWVLAGGRCTLMLSRVADALFWMSRYLERAEHVARLLDVWLPPGARPARRGRRRRASCTGRPWRRSCSSRCRPTPRRRRAAASCTPLADVRPRQPGEHHVLRRRARGTTPAASAARSARRCGAS